jgi:flagellar capping protein FliD
MRYGIRKERSTMRAALAHSYQPSFSPLPVAPEAPVRFSARRDADAIFDSDWRQIGWRMGTLLDAACMLTKPETFNSPRGRSSDSLTASITAYPGAPAGEDALVVTQLAQRHQIITRGFSAPDVRLGQSGTLTVNDARIAVDPADTMADIAAKVVAAGAGVTAAVVAAGRCDYRLVLTSATAGDAGAIALGGAFADAFIGDVVHAQDARFTLDGVPFSRPSNVIDDLLPGTVITLFAGTPESPACATLAVSPDVDRAVLAVSRFISAFNDMQNLVTELSFLSGAGEAATGASTAPELPDGLLTAVIAWDVDGALETIGIARDDWGLLEVDYSRLRAALAETPSDIAGLFGAIDWGQAYADTFNDVEEVEGRLRLITISDDSVEDAPESRPGVLDQLIDILSNLLAPMLRARAA